MHTRFLVLLALSTLAGCGAAESPVPQGTDLSAVLDESDTGATNVPDDSSPDAGFEEIDPDAEPHSLHHRLTLLAGGYVGASVEVRVDEVPRHGLRFFALQVNFADVAWAHGGLQGDPDHGKANWGGLVSGIDYDFAGAEQQVLAAIQNLPGRTSPVSWQENTWYRYSVQRGQLEVLPAGEYAVLDDEPVTVVQDREMWRWTFTISTVDDGEVVWTHDLFVAHPEITSATYWTETGYGIDCTDKLTIQWRNPLFQREDGTSVLPSTINKSMGQSTCPSHSTTDMASVENGGEWGTIQWYGVERPAASEDGDLLYLRARN